MEEVRKKPKILALRPTSAGTASESDPAAWARLSKALNTFTDLEIRPVEGLLGEKLSELVEGFDHAFLDTSCVDWAALGKTPCPQVCLVQPSSFDWTDPAARAERLSALSAHPFLILEDLAAADLLRVVHLYLAPKRLAGVTPLMGKDSLILAEKVTEPNSVGQLLDRVCTFLEKVDDFKLQARLPDVRQVLSALLLEGLKHAREQGVLYPNVDFQISPSSQKLAVNLRFPRGDLSLDALMRDTLLGQDIFWHQIWQCSDLLQFTHHRAQDEVEVMILLYRSTRNLRGSFRSILRKDAEQNLRRDSMLDAPENYRFMLISEITAKTSEALQLFDSGEIKDELADLPEAAVTKIRQLNEKSELLSDHLRRKDEQYQELLRKNQALTQNLNARRSEVMKAAQARETMLEAHERKVRDLTAALERAQAAVPAPAAGKDPNSQNALQEVVARLEGTLRAAENEKMQLKESITNEQRRLSLLEQKYALMHKELSVREREIAELKLTVNKLKREAERPARANAAEEKKDNSAARLKELEDRELSHKQEIKRLAYKIEAQDKSLKFAQGEASEKQKLLDQKLKEAKIKEMELLRKVEELTAGLKKANKAA